MKSRLSALIGAAILTGALATGCTSGSGDAGESSTSATTTTTSTSATTTSSSAAAEPDPTSTPDIPAEPDVEEEIYTPEVVPEAQPDPEVEQYDPDPVIGFTGAPSVDSPHVLDKEVSSCGDPSIHEPGTTFFTDGTSGWTSTCAAQMG